MSMLPNFLNGDFVPFITAENAKAGKDFVDVIAPADPGQVLAQVPLCGAAEVQQAVEYASQALVTWQSATIKQRAAVMFKFHSLVEQHSQELAELIVQENGKNITEALADVAKGNETVEWATSLPQLAAGRLLEVSRGVTCQEIRKPLGIVGAIVPFNFPAMVPMWTVPIALTMGNCVILKPSEKVPLTMQRMAELMRQAGIPNGVFQIVHGAAAVVNALCEHPSISAVTFVGSSKVAEIVATKCRSLNKRVLALGGAKNHLLALPDCDADMAARDIVASFAGCCGQRCMAASVLILVGSETTAAFSAQQIVETTEGNKKLWVLLDKVVEAASKLTAGQQGGQVGPLIDEVAKARVTAYVYEAEAKGAKILLDGRTWKSQQQQQQQKAGGGNWFGPTVILHSSSSDRAMREEIFGPVLSVYYASSWAEALRIENENEYGNAACVYTEKGANAEWFTQRFRAAMLGVNIGIPVPREPFSFGGLYGTSSKFGDCDVTGDGAMEFFSNRIKITSKWSAPYGAAAAATAAANVSVALGSNGAAVVTAGVKRSRSLEEGNGGEISNSSSHSSHNGSSNGGAGSAQMDITEDKASFDGKM